MKQSFDIRTTADLNNIICSNGWTLQLLVICLKQQNTDLSRRPDLWVIQLVDWVNQLSHVGMHARNRKYSRLQFIENLLSLLGLSLTQRDFNQWILADSDLAPNGHWRR